MIEGLSIAMIILLVQAEEQCPGFKVIEGLRTIERQHELVDKGVSWTLNSKHLHGNAIDFIPAPFKGWDDIDGFIAVGECFKTISPHVTYGGDWKVGDYGHVEINIESK